MVRSDGMSLKRIRTPSKGSDKKRRRMISISTRVPMTIPRALVDVGKQAFPPRMSCTLRYSEFIGIQPNIISGFGYYAYTINGMFDPNITGTGRQPRYFDQYMALYSGYTVTKSRIRISPVTLVDEALSYGCFVYSDPVPVSSAVDWLELPGAKYEAIKRVQDSTGQNQCVNPCRDITQSWNGRRNFGSAYEVGAPEYSGTITTNPANQQYYIIATQNNVAGSDSFFDLVEEFDVTFFNLKPVAVS